MSVISISRQFGAGGKTLGERLARRLSWRFVFNDILDQVAQEAQVSLEWVSAVDESYGDRLMHLVETLVPSDFIQRHLGEGIRDFDEKKYRAFLEQTIRRLADAGEMVIVGRGSQFILAGREDTVRVLLVADRDDRVAFLQKVYHLDRDAAEKLVRKEERRRERFVNGLNVSNPNSARHYHLVVNRSLVSLEETEELVMSMVASRGW